MEDGPKANNEGDVGEPIVMKKRNKEDLEDEGTAQAYKSKIQDTENTTSRDEDKFVLAKVMDMSDNIYVRICDEIEKMQRMAPSATQPEPREGAAENHQAESVSSNSAIRGTDTTSSAKLNSSSNRSYPIATIKTKPKRTKGPIYLDKPNTYKCRIFLQNKKWSACVVSMQGWRKRMEDAHTALLESPFDPDVPFFGVFDGHGGSMVSTFAARNLHKLIMDQELYRNGRIEAAIRTGYIMLDKFLLINKIPAYRQGTTAVTVLIKDGFVYCGNVGDSRAIALIDGYVTLLSNDHKPECPEEFARVAKAGFTVTNNRINGSLSMSRSLGDFKYKNVEFIGLLNQPVIAVPEIIVKPFSPGWEFIVIACDGIWEVLNSFEVGAFVKDRIKNNIDIDVICCDLLNTCLAPDNLKPKKGCDNMTVIIIIISKAITKITSIHLPDTDHPIDLARSSPNQPSSLS